MPLPHQKINGAMSDQLERNDRSPEPTELPINNINDNESQLSLDKSCKKPRESFNSSVAIVRLVRHRLY